MTTEKTVADVFKYIQQDLPDIIDALSGYPCFGGYACLVVESMTKVHLATFRTEEGMQGCSGYIVPIALPVFTDETAVTREKLCKELGQQALAGYVQIIQDNANAVLTHMDEAAMKIYKGLAEIKLAQGFDIDTIVDQIDGERSLSESQLDELWNYLEAE